MAEIARLVLHRGNDPFTPPRSKVEWNNDGWLGTPSMTVRWSYMQSELTLFIDAPDGEEVKKAFEEALERAALKAFIAGLTAAYLTGGMAALTAATGTFIAELDTAVEAALQRAIDTSYRIENPAGWGDWQ